VRARYTLATKRSKRRRSAAESRRLDQHGASVAVFELQGDLRFATLEPVLRELDRADDALRFAVLDFKRVSHVDEAATRMLAALVASGGRARAPDRADAGAPRRDAGVVRQRCSIRATPQRDLPAGARRRPRVVRAGVAHARRRRPAAAPPLHNLAEHRWCARRPPGDLVYLQAYMDQRRYDAGTLIVQRGDAADRLYFLLRGEVSVVLAQASGGTSASRR
jgi:glutaminase